VPPEFNEYTLGIERLTRAGNIEGANVLLKQLADLIGVGSLGKIKKAPAPQATA
jgi:hypothetical protein